MQHARTNINNVSTRNATTIALCILTVVMLMAAGIFYVQQTANNTTKGWVMHTYEVTGHIQLLFHRLKDVELGQRGYVISSDEQYLMPYYDALKDSMGTDAKSTQLQQHHSIKEELKILRELAQDNLVQIENLDELESDIADLLSYWENTIKRRQAKSPSAPLSKADFSQENQLMDNVRSLIGIMMAEENHLLSKRIESDEASTHQSIVLTFSGIAFFYIVIMISILLYQKNSREKAEALARSEGRYDLVVRGMSVGMWDWNNVTGELYWSPKFLDILGVDHEHFKPSIEEFFYLLHPDYKEATEKMLTAHLEQNAPYNIEYRLRHRNGEYIWLHASGQAEWDENGKPIRMAGSVVDITPRKTAEEERKKLIALIEESVDFIGMAGLDGTLQYHNQSALRMVGLPEDTDMSQMKIGNMHPAWAAKIVLEQAIPATYEKGSWQGETALLHSDGHEISVLQNLALHRNAKGEPICFTTIMRDITERKNAEEQREILIKQLADSNTELERFAYVASHDMQEPLRMIANFSKLIATEQSERLDEEGKMYLDIVTESATRMQSMIEDLLEYARVGSEAIRFEAINAGEELQHVLSNLSRAIDEHEARVTCEHLPEIQGNPIQFMRLLQNLIGNGLKYQAPGVIPTIHVGVEDKGDNWQFYVRDNGIGMEDAYVTKIFEPFKRLHTWQEYKGTGIGLAVCKKIVENHRGKIWATSVPGKGSIFYFTIPKIT